MQFQRGRDMVQHGSRLLAPIQARMAEHHIWTFERGAEQLIVRRRTEPETFAIEIESSDGVPRVHRFDDEDKSFEFQHDLQYMLVHSGWTLMKFSPDRRKGRDRRGFPRVKNDRRRWWTDGVEPVKATSRRGRRK